MRDAPSTAAHGLARAAGSNLPPNITMSAIGTSYLSPTCAEWLTARTVHILLAAVGVAAGLALSRNSISGCLQNRAPVQRLPFILPEQVHVFGLVNKNEAGFLQPRMR